jgi:endonuclease/exonuclease/phosphatase family metal-dependent hydrolase
MSSNSVTIRQLSRHTNNQSLASFRLRQILRLEEANLHMQVKVAPFSLMTQNMALLVFPGDYLGTNRAGAVEEIISRIKNISPDIVGLCEVFADDERETIRTGVKHIYPHFQEGPDEDDLESDGGLLLLSKHPILQHHQIIYQDCAGSDCWANKGVLHIRVQPPSSPMPYDIFFSHTQNIEEDGGKEVLYKQLTRINQMIQDHADPNIPTLIMGDLNIPGEVPKHYNQLIKRLGKPVDFWIVAGNTPASGFTFTSDNDFYEDDEDNPHLNHRLDYILMKAGLGFIPIMNNFEILKFNREGRFISDHFGLHVQFEQLVQVDFSAI